MTPLRVVVFLDCQNSYRGARDQFAPVGAPSSYGNVNPLSLGLLIAKRVAKRGQQKSRLLETRVYLGLPGATKDPKGYSATMRMMQAQQAAGQGKVVFVPRVLRYPPRSSKEPPFQKGVDVALAVDFVTMGVQGDYDVGVIFSLDSDLGPALETVAKQGQGNPPIAEVAAWGTPKGHLSRLSIETYPVWCHWLDQRDFEKVADHTNYTLKLAQATGSARQ